MAAITDKLQSSDSHSITRGTIQGNAQEHCAIRKDHALSLIDQSESEQWE